MEKQNYDFEVKKLHVTTLLSDRGYYHLARKIAKLTFTLKDLKWIEDYLEKLLTNSRN